MKTIVLLILLAIVLSFNITIAQPKIEAVGGTSLDFGEAYTGQKVDHVAIIKNVGTDTLRITDVKAQCGCTAAMMTNKLLGPGDTGKLSISFDTHNYGGSKVSKQVYISSNDTSNPKLTITFTTNVINALEMEPRMFTFDNMKLDSTMTKTITITNPSPKNSIKIISVESNESMLKISLMKNQLMPGEKTQIQATFHPKKSGTFQGAIQLVTDHSFQSKFEIRYYAWVNRK